MNCEKCLNEFKHEEEIVLFKQHQYHFRCFLCFNCRKQLSHQSFYLDEKLQLNISNPQIFCENCFFQRTSLCFQCQKHFISNSIIIEYRGNEYHHECFLCSKCHQPLRGQVFYSKNELLFCQICMNELEPCLQLLKTSQFISKQCKKCGEIFQENEMISMYQSDCYHSDCLRCIFCQTQLLNQGFFRQEDGCLSCLNCQIENGPHCQICNKPFLTGESFCQFNGQWIHQACFSCDFCRMIIDRKGFSCQNEKIICENCLKK